MKRILLIVFTLTLCFAVFSGCSNNKYNAKLFDTATDWINEDFASTNIVRMLGNPEDDYPKTRTFIVDTQEEYDQIFNESATQLNVDFNTQMLVVYTFSTEYHRKNKLKELTVEDGTLTITYQIEKKSGVGDASLPYQRWFVVKLDKLEIDSVVFEESN